MQTFYQWLQNFKAEDTFLGDLARAVSFDQDRPQVNTLSAWENHLKAVSAYSEVIKFLKQEAWPQYISYQQDGSSHLDDKILLGSVDNYGPQPDDERWIIQRPILPNYWRSPSLMRVCCRPLDDDEYLSVLAVSGKMYCEAVAQFGRYFRCEFGYDFPPYDVSEHCNDGDEYIHPYLFTDLRSLTGNSFIRPIGACGFRFLKEESQWMLTWVWLHPFTRRRGYLSKAWDYFCRLYGDFEIEYPLSDAMKAFLEKQGKTSLKE